MSCRTKNYCLCSRWCQRNHGKVLRIMTKDMTKVRHEESFPFFWKDSKISIVRSKIFGMSVGFYSEFWSNLEVVALIGTLTEVHYGQMFRQIRDVLEINLYWYLTTNQWKQHRKDNHQKDLVENGNHDHGKWHIYYRIHNKKLVEILVVFLGWETL